MCGIICRMVVFDYDFVGRGVSVRIVLVMWLRAFHLFLLLDLILFFVFIFFCFVIYCCIVLFVSSSHLCIYDVDAI